MRLLGRVGQEMERHSRKMATGTAGALTSIIEEPVDVNGLLALL